MCARWLLIESQPHSAPLLHGEGAFWLLPIGNMLFAHGRNPIVSKGMANFVEVGNALMAIRDEFKGEFPSLGYKDFEDYCLSKWGLCRQVAYQQIAAAKTVKNLDVSKCLHGAPKTGGQVRPLTKLKSPDEQREAWKLANESSNGKPTAKDVEAAVETVCHHDGSQSPASRMISMWKP